MTKGLDIDFNSSHNYLGCLFFVNLTIAFLIKYFFSACVSVTVFNIFSCKKKELSITILDCNARS